MAGESRACWIWLTVMIIAASLMAIGLVCRTIALHPDAMGFIVTPANAEPTPAPPVVYIRDDPGGSVAEYYRKYKSLSDAGAEVHFHGGCFSACTMVLFTSFSGIKACSDEGTIFGFHKPFGEGPDGAILRSKTEVKASRRIWQMWLASLPDGLHRYLQRSHVPSVYEGAEPNTMLLIPAKYLMPTCPVTVAAQ